MLTDEHKVLVVAK